MTNTFSIITKWIQKETGVNKSSLKSSTRIYEDLRMDGEDAFELLKSFEHEFKLDMQNFDFNQYFAPEGIDLIGAISRLFNKNKINLQELTSYRFRRSYD
jgi:acyl carrier protein